MQNWVVNWPQNGGTLCTYVIAVFSWLKFHYFLPLADAKETQSKSKKASAAPDDKINDSLNETLNTQQTPTTSSQASLDSKSSGKDLFRNGRNNSHDFLFWKSLWGGLHQSQCAHCVWCGGNHNRVVAFVLTQTSFLQNIFLISANYWMSLINWF